MKDIWMRYKYNPGNPQLFSSTLGIISSPRQIWCWRSWAQQWHHPRTVRTVLPWGWERVRLGWKMLDFHREKLGFQQTSRDFQEIWWAWNDFCGFRFHEIGQWEAPKIHWGSMNWKKTHGTLVEFQPCETAVVGYFCPVTLRDRNGVSARKSLYI